MCYANLYGIGLLSYTDRYVRTLLGVGIIVLGLRVGVVPAFLQKEDYGLLYLIVAPPTCVAFGTRAAHSVITGFYVLIDRAIARELHTRDGILEGTDQAGRRVCLVRHVIDTVIAVDT